MERESFPASPETPVVNQLPVKNSKLLILLILLVIVLTTFTGVTIGYLLGSSKNQVAVSVPITSPSTVISSPSPTPDPTANWKTYIDTNGYSLKYPSSWSVKSSSKDITLNTDDKLHFIKVQQFIIPQNLTLEKFIYNDGLGENYGKAYLDGNKINLTFKNTSQHPIYNTFNPSNWGSAQGILIRFIQNQNPSNKYAWFSLEPYNPGGTPIPLEKEHEGIYYQILSTFKFLE